MERAKAAKYGGNSTFLSNQEFENIGVCEAASIRKWMMMRNSSAEESKLGFRPNHGRYAPTTKTLRLTQDRLSAATTHLAHSTEQ